MEEVFLKSFRPGQSGLTSHLENGKFSIVFQASVDLPEEDGLVFAEVEAEFAENQVKFFWMALFHELVPGDFENIFLVDKGVNVDEDSFLALGFASLNDGLCLLAFAWAQVDSPVVIGEEVGDKFREAVNQLKVKEMVSNLCVALWVVLKFLLSDCAYLCEGVCTHCFQL